MSEFDKDINVPSRKGVFIPDITVEMLRNASLEGVEDLLASGEMEDISLPSVQPDLSDYSDKLWRAAYERGKKEAQPEIIRCKDCKHKPYPSDNYDYNNGNRGFEIIFPDYRCPCRCDDEYYNRIPDDDWFCGNAERRIDE